MLEPSGGERKRLALTDFLDVFLDCQCSDPRDNLIPFKYLLEESLQDAIEINYTKDKEVLIPEIFSNLIKRTQSLYILTIRSRQISSEKIEWQRSMPSWCPFVGTPYRVPKTTKHSPEVGQNDAKIYFIEDEDHLVLKTTGIVLGKVLQIQKSKLREQFRRFRSDKDRNRALKQVQSYRNFLSRFHFTKFPACPRESNAPTTGFGSEGVWYPSGFDPKMTSALENFTRRTFGRAICLLKWNVGVEREKGRLRGCAWVPNDARPGDHICLLSGYKTAPILLHPIGEQYFRVIGDAWTYFAKRQLRTLDNRDFSLY
jgi:hypothetical protein